MIKLEESVRSGGLFQGYAYGYPHKMAYRRFEPALSVKEVWRDEERDSLFLYVHIPFCSYRCGFCNLFTTSGGEVNKGRVNAYLESLERQVEAVSESLGDDARFARMAVGGGTPTFLRIDEWERLFRALSVLVPDSETIPISVEMSPDTVDREKMRWLREGARVERASLGVQSFIESETRTLGRPQRVGLVISALEEIRSAGFPIRNIDLIYGMEGQDWESWRRSLSEALRFEPEELFLYPLYVREKTGLARKGRAAGDHREDLYRRGRDWLLERGYTQISMRLFRLTSLSGSSGPTYCCQEDGMVGLGAGARSYTRSVHYSTEWAVGRTGVVEILDHYSGLDLSEHGQATHGALLDDDDQRRRYVIKSVLRRDGLDLAAYESRFGVSAWEDFSAPFAELIECGAMVISGNSLRPTTLGLEWSDVIGPWIYSDEVKRLISEFEVR
jgi:oxygen-independent coproporphyrinogen-3 oxidase